MSRRLAAPLAALLVTLPAVAGVAVLVGPMAFAGSGPVTCDVAQAGIEDLIARTPALRAEANVQVVRDLRTLRDAAIVLDTYKRPEECRRLVALVRRLAANPGQAIEASGDTDEDAAERVAESREPKAPEGKAPEGKAPEGKAPEGKAPEGKAPEGKAPEGKAVEGKGGGVAKPKE